MRTDLFLAPYINSYKRFQQAGTFAPTRAVWSGDKFTAGFRLCGQDSPRSASSAALAAPISTLSCLCRATPPVGRTRATTAELALSATPMKRRIPRDTADPAPGHRLLDGSAMLRQGDAVAIIMSTPRAGSRPNTTAASPTGSCAAASKGPTDYRLKGRRLLSKLVAPRRLTARSTPNAPWPMTARWPPPSPRPRGPSRLARYPGCRTPSLRGDDRRDGGDGRRHHPRTGLADADCATAPANWPVSKNAPAI